MTISRINPIFLDADTFRNMSDGSDDVRLASVKGTRSIMRFAFPTILMMLFTSSYTMADGLMVSNLINTDAFAAVNIAMPLYSVVSAIGFMFASGGSALVSRKLGEGRLREANSDFTSIVIFSFILGAFLAVLSILFLDPLMTLIGADDTLKPYTGDYLRTIAIAAPFFIFQFIAYQFLVVTGRPALSLGMSIVAGLVNIVLDYVLISVFDMGVSGAAIASALSVIIPSLIAVAIFLSKGSTVHFVRPSFDFRSIGRACYNGMSEMVSELSGSISALAFNLVMMSYIGPDGVAAITIVMYANFLSLAVIIGYSTGIAPVMGYHFGNRDSEGMTSLYRTSISLVLLFSLFIFVSMELFGEYIVRMFDAGNINLRDIATYGIRIHAFAFLTMGFNVYVSSLFTSLSDGTRSAVVSLLRGLVILVPMIVLLPTIFGLEGIWLAVPVTDAMVALVSLYMIRSQSGKYGIRMLIHNRSTS